MKRDGFTLIELMVALGALSAVSLAVALPALTAASSVETPLRSIRLAHLLAEERAAAAADVAAVAAADWPAQTAAWRSASPFVPHAPVTIDEITAGYARSVVCVDAALDPAPTCADGYALITVRVATSQGEEAEVTFLATPEGL
jgi:prepilin-type N-terminal cleavage/methylation domain-containing protein